MSDYRPINLMTSVYKIIAEMFSLLLSEVLDDIISPNQSAFVGGRQILDPSLIVNEYVEYMRRTKKEDQILKLDFEKAYDREN